MSDVEEDLNEEIVNGETLRAYWVHGTTGAWTCDSQALGDHGTCRDLPWTTMSCRIARGRKSMPCVAHRVYDTAYAGVVSKLPNGKYG